MSKCIVRKCNEKSYGKTEFCIEHEDWKKCEAPNCNLIFKPYSSRQRVCKKNSCRAWLYGYYQPATYQLNLEYVSRMVDMHFTINSENQKDTVIDFVSNLIFTNDDMTKVGEYERVAGRNEGIGKNNNNASIAD